ncbi:hypothetical protein [Roseibium sp. RKSG952]|uniref:hypothetical protein n=1 Tax=Roseibium sp. RKSG952 TaxID=2529384 RepID=UPI0012BD3F6E|nr:hypothetical protein [Roseibium sp. RKSG952]MTH95484.1 hypothetical protein [Roseibium sp. RKSG952]
MTIANDEGITVGNAGADNGSAAGEGLSVNSSDHNEETTTRRPPSLEKYLWDAIPEEERPPFLKGAARALLRAVHPDEFAREWIRKRKRT